MNDRRDDLSLYERIRNDLMEGLRQEAPSPEELEEGREIAEYAMDMLKPALDAIDKGEYLDCFRHLDSVAADIARLGLGWLVKVPAQYAARVSQGSAQADLIRGWADRAVGYVQLIQGDPGMARRRFRSALRHGRNAQDTMLIGASLLSIGYTYQEQGIEDAAREAYEEALPYARQSGELWLLAYVTSNLAGLLISEEADRAEALLEEGLRAQEAEGMSRVPYLTNLAAIRSEQGRFSEAERLSREALHLSTQASDDSIIDYRDVVLPMQNLAGALADQRRFSEASETYEDAIRLAQEAGDPLQEGVLRRSLAVCLARADDFVRSHEQFALLLRSAEHFGIPEENLALIVRDLGATAWQAGRLEEATEYFRSARRRFKALRDRAGEAESLLNEAAVRQGDDIEVAARLIREALDVLKGTRHHDLKLDAYDRLTLLLFEQPRVEEALKSFGEERRLLRRLGKIRTLARRLAEVASILANSRLNSDAIRMLRQSVRLYEELDDEVGYAHSRNDLATALVEYGRVREAEVIYLDNLERARRLENRVLEAQALLNLGEMRRVEGRTEEAVADLRKSVELSRSLNELSGVSLGLNNLGLALEQRGDADQARQAFEESLSTASEAKDDAAAARALSSLGSAALERGDLGKARELYEQAIERAARSEERGLEAEMTLNLAVAVQRELGTAEAKQIAERAVQMAHDTLHNDTAYTAAAAMVEWLVHDRDFEEAGEWSAYALVFGPFLSGQVDSWAGWIIHILSNVPTAEDRRRFFEAMQDRSRSIEEDMDISGSLVNAVHTLRNRLG